MPVYLSDPKRPKRPGREPADVIRVFGGVPPGPQKLPHVLEVIGFKGKRPEAESPTLSDLFQVRPSRIDPTIVKKLGGLLDTLIAMSGAPKTIEVLAPGHYPTIGSYVTNKDALSLDTSLTSNFLRGTATHEFGHRLLIRKAPELFERFRSAGKPTAFDQLVQLESFADEVENNLILRGVLKRAGYGYPFTRTEEQKRLVDSLISTRPPFRHQ